jgi:hypothetical protein
VVMIKGSHHCEWSGPRPDRGYDKPGRGPELSGFVGGDDRESLEPYVYCLREAIKIQANLAASHLS